MALTDALDVIDGLRASHITILHNRIIVILRCGEFQHVGCHLTPAVGIMAVALRQGHRIADMERAAVVTRQDEVRTLIAIADIRESLLEFRNQFGSSGDVLLRIIELAAGHTQMVSRTRHDLHETLGTYERDGLGVERRFLIALGGHQAPVPADITAVGHEELVVVRDDALAPVEHR